MSIDSLSLINETFSSTPTPIANPFSIMMESDLPAVISSHDSLEVRIIFDGVTPGTFQSRIIAYSNLETISLIIRGEVASQNNVNEILLPEGTSLVISTITDQVERPWDIEIAPDGYLWVTERDLGQVKRINPENGNQNIVLTLEPGLKPPAVGSNGGLLGIAIHPDFNNDKPWVYLAHTNIQFRQVLSRFEFNGSELVNRMELLSVQDSVNNYGSRISFLADTSLLWTTGTDGSGYAQNSSSLAGKIIRISEDGSVPQDNPFANSANENEQYIYSLGHRNIQGLHVEETEDNPRVFASEHGEIQNDEINLIVAGENYGWPDYEGWTSDSDMMNRPPLATYDLAPTGIALYNHEAIPEWQNTLLVGTNKGQRLLALTLNEDGELIDHDPDRPVFSTLQLTENNQYFFYNNGFPDRPRDIEVDELGRVYLAMFGTGGTDRILRLENQHFTSVERSSSSPYSIFLSENYPNPFNPTTRISFELPQAELVQLKVYNMLGQEVASLIDGRMNSGSHSVNFDAGTLPSGVYIYRLVAGNQSIVKKMMLIK
ncbi:MAG: PQQ-dependent sugar dehydrogenase [Balneola sp.]